VSTVQRFFSPVLRLVYMCFFYNFNNLTFFTFVMLGFNYIVNCASKLSCLVVPAWPIVLFLSSEFIHSFIHEDYDDRSPWPHLITDDGLE